MDSKVKLDDSSYEQLYEGAMERLRQQAPWWTHREVSDPGITLLEMWAILMDMQSYYLDQLQESHFRKYNKLLGEQPDAGESAWVWITFDEVTEELVLPRGTKLLADDIVFELEEETRLIPNKIVGVYRNSEHNLAHAMYMPRKSRFALESGKSLFSFALQRRPEAKELSFFILLDETKRRNPAGLDFCMAELTWEYRSGEGWREAALLQDETCGLLYSGFVRLELKEDMVCTEGVGYELRCRIKKGEYDIMPVIYRICINIAKAVQQNTLCCTEERRFLPGERMLSLDSYLAQTGELTVLQEKGEGLWEDITPLCAIDPPITAQIRKRRITLPEMPKLQNAGLFRIVCSVPGWREAFQPVHVTGVTSQQISFPIENIKRDSVKLLLRKGSGSHLYEEYTCAEPEECPEKGWHWAEEEDAVILGDGRHGELPQEAEDGVLLTSLIAWEGDGGNIAVGRVEKWERPELFPNVFPVNQVSAKGGRKRRMPSEQFGLLRHKLLRQNRMVTNEDIQALALKTPGLLIRGAEAVWKNGGVEVTIYPAYPLRSSYCREKYRNAVAAYLEQFRLVGTCIRVRCEADPYRSDKTNEGER